MTQKLAKVAFENKGTGARLEGEFVADTGVSWMIKPAGKPVQVLSKTEWDSAAPAASGGGYEDIFSSMFGGRR